METFGDITPKEVMREWKGSFLRYSYKELNVHIVKSPFEFVSGVACLLSSQEHVCAKRA